MLFTKSTVYTLQALIELSKFNEPVDVTKLSEITSIPKPFLAKLLQTLSKKGYIKSFKGIHGGFLLEKKPEEIVILELFKDIENKNSLIFYCSGDNKNCVRDNIENCKVNSFFVYLEKEVGKILENMTLKDIIKMGKTT